VTEEEPETLEPVGERKIEMPDFESTPRPLQVIVGCCCAILGPALMAATLLLMFLALSESREESVPSSIIIFLLTMLGLGAMITVWAWRLLTGRTRSSDGGLLSPLGLEIAGFCMGIGHLCMLTGEPWALLDSGLVLSLVIACFVLARVRRRLARAMDPWYRERDDD
jgi:hypothetical protein